MFELRVQLSFCACITAAALLTVQGQQVVSDGNRRWIDAHCQRGNFYLRIGWNWVKGALHQDRSLFLTILLSTSIDPEPAFASKDRFHQMS
jgi:hypothetical protein